MVIAAVAVVAVVVIVSVLVFLPGPKNNPSTKPTVQPFSGSCDLGGFNGTGRDTYCSYNVTFASPGNVTLNWSVLGGNATWVTVTVYSDGNGGGGEVITGSNATTTGSLTFPVCNSAQVDSGACKSQPGVFVFEFQNFSGGSAWANYRVSGYFASG